MIRKTTEMKGKRMKRMETRNVKEEGEIIDQNEQ